jgi:hypothetical protein
MKNINSKIALIMLLLATCVFDTSAQTPVATHGALSVTGNRITNQYGDTVSFAGNSMFWSNTGWEGAPFYNTSCVDWLQSDWNTTIVRAAMGVEENGGYLMDVTNKTRLKTVVDAAIANDMYVIIDWHSHHAENYQSQAIAFFQEMATTYGGYDNVIYEIYNEPLQVSWSNTIKPYATAVTAAIRAIDPDNLIVVGTPTWSQDVDVASLDPITGYSNIAYTLHFYAGTHGQSLRNKAITAMNNGIALFVTEWGTVDASGNGAVATTSVNEWTTFMCQNKLSHCNWSINDKNEGASALVVGTSPSGNWSANELTASGTLVKSIIQTWDANCSAQVTLANNDAGISTVSSPLGTICSDSIQPSIVLNNYGNLDLTSATINYNIDGGPNLTYTWNGNLTTGQSIIVNLPSQTVSTGTHTFNAFTVLPNGVVDSVGGNDLGSATFTSNGGGTMVELILSTDCWGSEVSWVLEDDSNNQIDTGSGYSNNSNGEVISTQYCLVDDCYNFTINDSYGDGMNGMLFGCSINGSYHILNLETGDTLASTLAVDAAYAYQELNSFCLPSGPACSLTATSNVVNESCVAMNDGAITVTPSAGAGPYVFTLGSSTNTTGVFDNLIPGSHAISVTDGNGCQATLLELVSAASSFGSVDSDQSICVGNQVSIGAYGGTSFVWYEGGGQIDNGNSTIVSPSVSSTYNVDITNGSCTESYSILVDVNSVPDATFTSVDFCQNSTNLISNVVTSGGIFSYNGSDGSSINTTNGIITNAVSGTNYSITYAVVDANGCSSQFSQAVNAIASPQIDAGLALSTCSGGTVILTAINPDNAQVSWDNNVTDNVVFTPISSQNYTVTAIQNGCSSTDVVLVQVLPLPSIDAGSNIQVCSGNQAVLTALNPDGAQVTWDNGVDDSVPFTPISSPLTYTVTADLNGCVASDNVVVTMINTPSVNAGMNQVVCEGETIVLIANNPDNANITWDNAVIDNVVFTPISSQIYTVTATQNGCSSTDDVSVQVTPLPSIGAGNNFAICAGNQAILSALNPDGAQIAWDNGVIDNVPFVPTSSPLICTVTAELNGCSASDTVVVTTINPPSVNAGMDQVICAGETITLSADNPDNANISWDNGILDGVLFSVQNGTTTYTATAELSGCVSTDVVIINGAAAPIVSGIVTHDNGTNSGSIDVTVVSGYTIVSTSWSNFETTEDIDNLAAGTYSIVVEDENGCETTETFVVNTSVGIPSQELSSLLVYPNPVRETINIEYEGEFQVKILDAGGRILIEKRGVDMISIDVSVLTSGAYILWLENSGEMIKITKV